jgi:uncharacterized membrane protein YdjX (TVP38/TMEM64 family)
LRTFRKHQTIGPMKLANLIKWIDREWDQFPKASYSLCLILLAAWFPLMLIGWNAVTIVVGGVWGALWIALYAWRWLALIKRLDAKSQRKRLRR